MSKTIGNRRWLRRRAGTAAAAAAMPGVLAPNELFVETDTNKAKIGSDPPVSYASTPYLAGGGMTIVSKAVNYTANANEWVKFDCTTAGLQLTLPAAPNDGDEVAALLAVTASAHKLTVSGGTNTIDKTSATTMSITVVGEAWIYRWSSDAAKWLSRPTSNAARLRANKLTDAITVTPDSQYDENYLTSLSQDSTIANPTNTAVQGQELVIRIRATAIRNLTWGNQYRAQTNPQAYPLPAATVANTTMSMRFRWNSDETFWDLVGS